MESKETMENQKPGKGKKIFLYSFLAVILVGVITYAIVSSGDKEVVKSDPRSRGECSSCHSKMAAFADPVKHKPFAEWQCLDCHNKHDPKTNKAGLKKSISQLCYDCHSKFKLSTAFTSVHPPFAGGMCIQCHEPHASKNKNLLSASPQALCRKCHNMQYRYQAQPVQHKPFASGNCADCHSPHFSESQHLTRLPGGQLCFSCHFDRAGEHLLASQHPPYQEGNCTGCHEPHAAPADKILRSAGNGLCQLCHADYTSRFSKTKHTKVSGIKPTGECLNCHLHHASSNAPLLRNESIQLCKSCHSNYGKEGKGHPVGTDKKDKWHGTYLKCASCHDPHGTTLRYFLRKDGDDLCVQCHGEKKPKTPKPQ